MRIQPRSVLGGMFVDPVVLTRFESGNTTLTERADIGCLLVSSAVDSDEISTRLNLAARFSFPLKGGRVAEARPYRVLWLTPRAWLVPCPLDDEWVPGNRVNERFPGKPAPAWPVTCPLGW